MKKLFVFAAALLALASCQQGEEPQAIVETREISFAPAANVTRATAAAETKTATLQEGFAVYGYVKASTGSSFASIFDNTLVEYTAATNAESQFGENTAVSVSNVWQPKGADVKYWAPNSEYWFSAYYPREEVSKYAFTTNGTTHTQTITGFAISEDHNTPDLVVAQPAKAVLADAQKRPAVGLTFDHMLARVKFTFTNTFADDNVTIKVKNVKLHGVIGTGDAEITAAGKATWTDKGTTKAIINMQDASDVFELAQNAIGTSVYRLFMPETVADGAYKLTFDLEVLADNVTVLTKSYTIDGTDATAPIALKGYEYVNGQSYSFNANISGDLLKNEIFPIQFDVKVTDWPTTDTVVDGDIMQ